MFGGDAVLFDRVAIIGWVVEGAGKACTDFGSIVFTETVLRMCGVDPSNWCHTVGPDCFAIHVRIEGL